MILGFGAIAGLANAGWYLAEGDYVNAALSGLSALAEVAGAMAGKLQMLQIFLVAME